MARIIVIGAGVVGLFTGMMLAKQGHEITVFEGDGSRVPASPDEAWGAWKRRGVSQFRQPHYLHARGAQIIAEQLPEVRDAMLGAACMPFDTMSMLPPEMAEPVPRDGDERLRTLTGRRAIIEYAVATTAERSLSIARGVPIREFIIGTPVVDGVPHVAGVRTADGTTVRADLVVDATGRHSKLPGWLAAIGARPPLEEVEDGTFIYYTRYFRSATGGIPRYRTILLTHYHSFSMLALPGDADTWSATAFIFAGDPVLKELRKNDRWNALFAACPLHAHWIDGEPLTDVLPMAGIADRYRRFVIDDVPVATGVLAVGDSWACTNPVGGRGITMGLIHAVGTAAAVREHLDDPRQLALAHDAMTEATVTPWYRNTVAFDRKRTAEIRATVEGRDGRTTRSPSDVLTGAMMLDPDLFRAGVEILSMLALPQDVMARPHLAKRLADFADVEFPPLPGPSRAEVVRMMAA
jgi:2-polyprenyl-6-methoxyphenol hydroxylase-like FAD-dependent oxidoreductase